MWLRSSLDVAVVQASSYSSDWTLVLGTSICRECSPKKQKTKQNNTKQNKIVKLWRKGGYLKHSQRENILKLYLYVHCLKRAVAFALDSGRYFLPYLIGVSLFHLGGLAIPSSPG